MPTNYTVRPSIAPTNYTTRVRPEGVFLMTQLLDFLMTQDNNYIVLQNSGQETIYTVRTAI